MRHTLAALRALVVLPFPPLPEGGAAERCAVALLRGLSASGVQTTALVASGPRPFSAPLPADLDVEVMRLGLPSARRARWDRILDPQSILRRGPFPGRVRELSRQADVVHFVDTPAGMAQEASERPAVVQIDRATLSDRDIRRPWRPADRETLMLWRAERRVCRRARWLLTNSHEVAQTLAAEAPRAEVAVAPLGLDPALYAPPAALQGSVLGLIGTAVWPPTALAVRRLVTRVWPLVRAQEPGATLELAGRGMERERFADLPATDGVSWHGFVPSAADFIRGLSVMLYPLSRGSGTKVKVLEALALGVPVVTTPPGAEGLLAPGGIAVETDDRRLADAAVALLRDARARAAAGAAARDAFARRHTPLAAAGPVVELYERMLR